MSKEIGTYNSRQLPLDERQQYIAKKGGNDIYQDTGGTNTQDNYFFPDNTKENGVERKNRTVQEGRGYNFTGVETAEVPNIVFTDAALNTGFEIEATIHIQTTNIITLCDTRQSNNFNGAFQIFTSFSIYHYLQILIYEAVGQHTWARFPVPENEIFNIKISMPSGWAYATDAIVKINDTVIAYQENANTLWDKPSSVDAALITQYIGGYYIIANSIGEIFYLKCSSADGEFIYNLDESSGLISYDSSGQDNHGTISLGGSTESSFHITSNEVPSVQNEIGYNVAGTDPANLNALIPIDQSSNGKLDVLGNIVPVNYYGQVQYPMLVKGSSVGNFDGVLYGVIPINAEIDITKNFEIILNYEALTQGTNRIFSYGNVHADGFGCYWNSLNKLVLESGTDILAGGEGSNTVGKHEIVLKHINGSITAVLDGVELITLASTPTTPTNNIYIGVLHYLEVFYATSPQKELYLKYYELDSGGNRIAELINLNFSETNGLTCFNTAANAPANSDMSWILNGSSDGTQWGVSDLQYPKNLIEGYYVDAGDDGTKSPISTGIYTIFIPPKLNSIIPTENTFNRNPFDAPALVASGIETTEDISYEDITGDNSRFNDDSEENRVNSLLAYSDFVEPISGSAGNFDGVITLTHPDLSGITIASYVGTATPSISVNTINVTIGILTELILSDGSRYVFSEESGLTYYDLLKQNNLTVNLNGSSDGTQFAQNANLDYHHNLEYGYRDNGTSLVPGDPNNYGSDVNGNAVDNLGEVKKYRKINRFLNK